MPTAVSPQWQDKANDFFSTSGGKLKEASRSAGTFVEGVAKDAKVNVSGVAGRVGSVVKNKWSFFQQPSTKHAMQERVLAAAATTSFFFRKGFSETKDKVTVGKTKVEEVAKKTALRSKSLISDIERWQKGVASGDVFGVPIEITVQRQQSSSFIPSMLVRCADHLISSGLSTQNLFKAEGDRKVVQQLVSLYNQESNAPLPEGTNPLDVATLVKCYLASLPEPLITFEIYDEIRGRRSNITVMRNILKKLPNVNYMTLELVTALLLHVSRKSLLNKMDARSLSEVMAPVIIWKMEQRPELYKQLWYQQKKTLSRKNSNLSPSYSAWDMLEEEGEDGYMDASSPISLDDGLPIDFAAIEVVQCLVEHHNQIFTDANETIWR